MADTAYKKAKETYAYTEGKVSGIIAAKADTIAPRLKKLEDDMYNKLHDDMVPLDYASIDDYLSKHPEIVSDIKKAFALNLELQGRPQDEIIEATKELTDPWSVYYVYRTLTTSQPDYTIDPSVYKSTVETAIDSGKYLTGGRRKKKNISRKYKSHTRTYKRKKSKNLITKKRYRHYKKSRKHSK